MSSGLKGDRTELRIVDPVLPVFEPPHATGHDDRGVAEAELTHHLAQRQHPRERRLRALRVVTVRDPVMTAGEPRVLVDHAAEQGGGTMIGPPPQRVEGPRRGHDRVIVNAEAHRDVG